MLCNLFNSLMQIQDAARSKVRNILMPSTAQLALQRILPFPCKKQYTVVILMPQASRVERLKLLMQSVSKSYSRDAKVSLMCPLPRKERRRESDILPCPLSQHFIQESYITSTILRLSNTQGILHYSGVLYASSMEELNMSSVFV